MFDFDIETELRTVHSALRGLYKRTSRRVRQLALVPDKIRAEIRDDIAAVRQRDPAAKSDVEVLLLSSGVHAILAYRVAHKLYLSKHYVPARLISQVAIPSMIAWL